MHLSLSTQTIKGIFHFNFNGFYRYLECGNQKQAGFFCVFRWIPDAIVFNSSHLYGTPSYWVQQFFTEFSGATLLNSKLKGNSSSIEASAISFQANGKDYIQIKVWLFRIRRKQMYRYKSSVSDKI